MSDTKQLTLFNYDQLDTPTRDFVQQRTSEIRDLGKRMAGDIIGIGQRLVEIKDRLDHGKFGSWLEYEFKWSRTMAWNFMKVAEAFKFSNFENITIESSALYLLAAPSTPKEARAEAIERAEQGEQITHSVAQEIVKEYQDDEPEEEPEPEEQERERFICQDCGEVFFDQVWHCPYCHAHWAFTQNRCVSCDHEMPTDAQRKDLDMLTPDLLQSVKTGDMTIPQAKKEMQARARQAERNELAQQAQDIKPDDRYHIEKADIRTYQTKKKYDFIITDPPYPREYLELYEILAQRALEWLKSSGLLIVMCGQSYFNQIVAMLDKHLEYYWSGCYYTPGQPKPLRQRQVNTTWKPILMYGIPGQKYQGKIFGDVWTSDRNEKEYHDWGQSVSGMYSLVSQVCLPGQSIFDPFLGAGTTGIAALIHGCLFDGIDIEQEKVDISRARIQEVCND